MNYKDFFKKDGDISNQHVKVPSKVYETERQRMLEMTRGITERILNEKKLRIFDFDDTLVQTDSMIHVEKDGETFSLTPGEFAVYEPEGDEKFDYSDFDKLIKPKQIKKYNRIFKNMLKASGNRKLAILTARGSTTPIKKYLRSIGVDEGKVNIIALANRKPEAKKRYVKYMIEHGYDDIFFIDDSRKNVKAIQSLEKEFPNVKITARVAKL